MEVALVHSVYDEGVFTLPEGVAVGLDEECRGRQGDILPLLAKLQYLKVVS